MKKLLLGSICLFLFASSLLILQVSCSKSKAQPQLNRPADTPIGKVIFVRDMQIWTVNYDGSSETQVAISLPSDVNFAFNNHPQSGLAISPDGKKIFFTALRRSGIDQINEMYSVNFDGTGLALIVGNGPASGFTPMIAF